jgi:hypothetical protein
MKLAILRWLIFVDEVLPACADGGMKLRKVDAVAMVRKPMAGQFGEDLSAMIEAGAGLGRPLSKRTLAAMRPCDVMSYGKGGVVGRAGQQEHASGLIITTVPENCPCRDTAGVPGRAGTRVGDRATALGDRQGGHPRVRYAVVITMGGRSRT